MDTAEPSIQHSQDVFSLSDQVLSEKLQFVEEIGFGNWGSVWLCKPKSSTSKEPEDTKLAVKLVHRSKTPTTAARVRSLWNEMKIIRSFKEDSHPSIIPFHSFIITPSFALITMAYLPTLIPVEVAETKCKDWFRSLLSGVRFLHKRGVVHNDIKPANILLSPERVPVLVDFGFAEKYDMESVKAFHSNLSYGTPEYLSPERARGLPHDTRKSDVWSLGVTFFEILVGRTPFENTDGEQLTTKEDLERYWSRTMKGRWQGSWNFSKGMERLLKRMISPNADFRCTISEAYADPYWSRPRESDNYTASHRRMISHNSSSTSLSSQERDLSLSSSSRSKFVDVLSPFNRSTRDKKDKPTFRVYDESVRQPVYQVKSASSLRRTVSRPDLKTRLVPKNRVQSPPANLSPIKASPPATPRTGKRKENTRLRPKSHFLSPLNQQSQVTRSDDSIRISRESQREHVSTKAAPIRPLMDLTQLNKHLDTVVGSRKKDEKKTGSVNQRVLEWEREKERLREMARLEDERDDEDETESVRSSSFSKISTPLTAPIEDKAEASPSCPPPSTPDLSESVGRFKHGFKLSLSKTVQMYKASLSQHGARSPQADRSSFDLLEEHRYAPSVPMEDAEADTTLPVVHNALRNERMAADNQNDRLLIWMRNVEKVVEDTRQNFASSATTPLPALPLVPPLSRSASSQQPSRSNTQLSSRLSRKVLPADQIFEVNDDATEDTRRAGRSLDFSVADVSMANATISPEDSVLRTPNRPRRATVSTGSPHRDIFETGSPSKRREKSRSHANLLQRHIVSPDSIRDIELNRLPERDPPRPARLSSVIDPSLFVAPTSASRFRENLTLTPERRPNTEPMTLDELTSSPCIIEPYPARKTLANSATANVPESPTTQKRIEGVFDRYLMTTGVKRVGAGYQSSIRHSGLVQPHQAPTSAKENNENLNVNYDAKAVRRRSSKLFLSTKKQVQPRVSSHDLRRPPSAQLGHVDELGTANDFQTPMRDGSISVVRRAFKAMSVKKLSSRA